MIHHVSKLEFLRHPTKQRAAAGLGTVIAALLWIAATGAAVHADAPGGRIETFEFDSKELGDRRKVHVYLPANFGRNAAEKMPYFIALHGLGGAGRDWFAPDLGGLKHDLDALIRKRDIASMVVIAPNGGNGYWTDHAGNAPGTAYGRFIAEVDELARRRYPLDDQRVAIVGASMGGHGALSFGLQYPERFRAIVSLAGALFDVPPVHRLIYKQVWGDPVRRDHWSKTAPMALATQPGLAERAPDIWLHCGRADRDRFWDWNARAFSQFRDLGYKVHFYENDGGHGWKTWREANRTWLVWLNERLKV